jgi:hypothetical protein
LPGSTHAHVPRSVLPSPPPKRYARTRYYCREAVPSQTETLSHTIRPLRSLPAPSPHSKPPPRAPHENSVQTLDRERTAARDARALKRTRSMVSYVLHERAPPERARAAICFRYLPLFVCLFVCCFGVVQAGTLAAAGHEHDRDTSPRRSWPNQSGSGSSAEPTIGRGCFGTMNGGRSNLNLPIAPPFALPRGRNATAADALG